MASATSKKVNKAARKAAVGKDRAAKPAKGGRAAAPRKAKAAKPSRNADEDPERSSPAMAEVDADVLEFIAAIDRFKQQHGRPFPSWSEVLMVVRELGYRRA